jgi:hypothetical protein
MKMNDRLLHYHARLKGIRNVPLPVIGIIALVAAINILVWIAVGIVLVGLRLHSLARSLLRKIANSMAFRNSIFTPPL